MKNLKVMEPSGVAGIWECGDMSPLWNGASPSRAGQCRPVGKRGHVRALQSAACATLALVLAGCNGIPTQGEKAARRQAQKVAAEYRPHGEKPVLPVLTSESGLSNFLAYAMLNQPGIEAAYYDWVASIERITQARSFPDPQFTFQMDVQNVVTSIMPGLMGTIPWPEKLRVGAEVASAESQAKFYAFQSVVLQTAFGVKR